MRTFVKLISPVLLTISTLSGAASLESSVNYEQTKLAPEVTLDLVQEIFGTNLDDATGMNKILLLGIGMDHTTPGSTNYDQDIGVPYIVDRGPKYWVSKLMNKEYDIDVLVNNALLLLFSKEDIPGSDTAAMHLLDKASDMGYWPADYYIADYNITNRLSSDIKDVSSKASSIVDPELKKLASETMAKFNNCAEMGFAPCQYRLGFWLTSAESTLKDGLDVLMHAIKTTLADKRYQGILEGSVIEAAKQVVMQGDYVGVDDIVREEYLNLMKDQINLLQRGKGLPAEIAANSKEFIDPVLDFIKNNSN